jgi:hypothetical protein
MKDAACRSYGSPAERPWLDVRGVGCPACCSRPRCDQPPAGLIQKMFHDRQRPTRSHVRHTRPSAPRFPLGDQAAHDWPGRRLGSRGGYQASIFRRTAGSSALSSGIDVNNLADSIGVDGVPAEPELVLSGQQQTLLIALNEKDPKAAKMYLGALHVFQQRANPDRLALAAHGLRELMEKLPKYVDIPARGQAKSQPTLYVKVRELADSWGTSHRKILHRRV